MLQPLTPRGHPRAARQSDRQTDGGRYQTYYLHCFTVDKNMHVSTNLGRECWKCINAVAFHDSPGAGSHRLEVLGKVFLMMVIGHLYLQHPKTA